jgi:hypothetical protein|tara:strand:- start:3995 stop:4243 length:249 start_codon:yes stop_codon:yes gene_type:complete
MSAFDDDVNRVLLATGGSETSGVRSINHNIKVGGEKNSLHCLGLAKDAVFDTPEGKRQATHWLRRLGYRVLIRQTHLHIQLD